MKRILIACGNGIATSTVVATKIKDVCQDNNVEVSITQCKLMEIDSKVSDFDILITTGKYGGGDANIPVVTAMSLLTGIDEEETLEKILTLARQ